MLMSGSKAKSCGLVGAFAAAAVLCGGAAYAADMDTMVTKAPPPPAITPPAACGSLYDFFLTACPLTWNGVTFYGTVDMGGSYHDARRAVRSELPDRRPLLAWWWWGCATGRLSGFFPGPNAMSQSNAGFKVKEAIGGRLVVRRPSRGGVRPVFAAAVQRAGGDAERHRHGAESGGKPDRTRAAGAGWRTRSMLASARGRMAR